jgi:hypothetical protein
MRNNHAQLSIIPLTIFSLLAACDGLSSKQKAAAANAMKALLNKTEPFMPVTEGQVTARRIREKYKLQTTDDIASILTNRLSEESKYNSIIRSKTLPVIWGVAKEHVDRASKLLED